MAFNKSIGQKLFRERPPATSVKRRIRNVLWPKGVAAAEQKRSGTPPIPPIPPLRAAVARVISLLDKAKASGAVRGTMLLGEVETIQIELADAVWQQALLSGRGYGSSPYALIEIASSDKATQHTRTGNGVYDLREVESVEISLEDRARQQSSPMLSGNHHEVDITHLLLSDAAWQQARTTTGSFAEDIIPVIDAEAPDYGVMGMTFESGEYMVPRVLDAFGMQLAFDAGSYNLTISKTATSEALGLGAAWDTGVYLLSVMTKNVQDSSTFSAGFDPGSYVEAVVASATLTEQLGMHSGIASLALVQVVLTVTPISETAALDSTFAGGSIT